MSALTNIDVDIDDWLNAELRHARSTPPRRYICPSCKQKRGVDITYGMPTPELVEQAERNEAVVGGCCPPLIDDPTRQCLHCHHQWAITRRPRTTR